MNIELTKDEIGLIIASLFLSKKLWGEPELTEIKALSSKLKELRDSQD